MKNSSKQSNNHRQRSSMHDWQKIYSIVFLSCRAYFSTQQQPTSVWKRSFVCSHMSWHTILESVEFVTFDCAHCFQRLLPGLRASRRHLLDSQLFSMKTMCGVPLRAHVAATHLPVFHSSPRHRLYKYPHILSSLRCSVPWNPLSESNVASPVMLISEEQQHEWKIRMLLCQRECLWCNRADLPQMLVDWSSWNEKKKLLVKTPSPYQP